MSYSYQLHVKAQQDYEEALRWTKSQKEVQKIAYYQRLCSHYSKEGYIISRFYFST